MRRLFGTDGVRGVVGKDLTEAVAFSLGRAAVMALARGDGVRPDFVIGRDTRASGKMLEDAIAGGIRSAGGDALLAGVQTTPAVAYLTTDLGASAGVVISASHNPPEYNGVKFFGEGGYKLADDLEERIESLLEASPTANGGEARPLTDGNERYLGHLAEAGADLTGLKIVVDCANGAASETAPEALRRLGAEVHTLNDRPDGSNINEGGGALHPEIAGEAVVRLGADAGVAHDGDADRAMFTDSRGAIVDGDQVLAACALAFKESGRLRGNTVVTTVMANLGFRRSMEEAGIEMVEAPVGDRYVLEEMLKTGAILGGEQSGHIIFGDRATTGDGILTAIEFLSLSVRSGSSIADLGSAMRKFPQVIENVRVADRDGLHEADEVWAAVRSAERDLGDRGRVLVRGSGTEPLVRVMVEAETDEEASGHAKTLADQVKRSLE
ncbi:MAG: phosphoglucosamine mutase [Actinomycetota bacterium]